MLQVRRTLQSLIGCCKFDELCNPPPANAGKDGIAKAKSKAESKAKSNVKSWLWRVHRDSKHSEEACRPRASC
eukprot:482231-Pleurochrysis_carterae.AAC.1